MSELTAIILAAGKGTRMRSKYPKVLHKVGGRPMLQHVIDAADEAGAVRKVIVVGHEAELVKEMVGNQGSVVMQKEQLGTGHAVLQTQSALKDFTGTVMILCGDTPLLDGTRLKNFFMLHKASQAAATVLTTILPDPTGYGRIIRDAEGNVQSIVEQKDATDMEQRIQEINTGIYCVECPLLFEALASVSNKNAQGEYYLTDILEKLNTAGHKVGGIITEDSDMVMGVNSRLHLAEAETLMRKRILNRLMENGVTVMDPASTFVEKSVTVGRDTVIYPYTWLEGNTHIGEECSIGPNVRLTNVSVGQNAQLQFLYGHNCIVKDGVTAGPYVHLRPDTVLENNVKIGNFVEVKNSHVGRGTKLPHLTYIGDSDLGSDINIGCGCITVNYDGKAKHRTVIEDNVFVGCNTNMIAPVTIKTGSYVGAGSTITKDVPENSLAVGRVQQRIIEGWAEKHRNK